MAELHFLENEIIVSKTDTSGKITYGNELFLKLSGYPEKDILLLSAHGILFREVYLVLYSINRAVFLIPNEILRLFFPAIEDPLFPPIG